MWSAWYCPHILYPPWSSENLFLARFEGHIWLLIVFDVIYSWWGRHVQASLETGRPVFLRLTVFRAWVAGLQREPLWSSLSTVCSKRPLSSPVGHSLLAGQSVGLVWGQGADFLRREMKIKKLWPRLGIRTMGDGMEGCPVLDFYFLNREESVL